MVTPTASADKKKEDAGPLHRHRTLSSHHARCGDGPATMVPGGNPLGGGPTTSDVRKCCIQSHARTDLGAASRPTADHWGCRLKNRRHHRLAASGRVWLG